MSALQKNLVATGCYGFFNFFCDDFIGQNIRVCIRLLTIECAERTISNADIGVVDVSVDDIGDGFISSFFAS